MAPSEKLDDKVNGAVPQKEGLSPQPPAIPIYGQGSPDYTFTPQQLESLKKALDSWLGGFSDLPGNRPLALTPGGWFDLQCTLQNWLAHFTTMKPPKGVAKYSIYH